MNPTSKKPTGRPVEMSGGKRVNVYLDAPSLGTAQRLGDGNISAGIRKALSLSQLINAAEVEPAA